MGKLLRTRIWERLDGPGMEFFRLWGSGDGRSLEGTVIVSLDGAPVETRYAIDCTPEWSTRRVRVDLVSGGVMRLLTVEHDGAGLWHVDGRHHPGLTGCLDIDLSVTPSTNLLPMRRVDPDVGESFEATAAWVRFPELTLEPLRQRYTRLDQRRWRYESYGFAAELEVDDLGIVTRYGDLWRAVGED